MNLCLVGVLFVSVAQIVCLDFDSYKITWDLPPVPTDVTVPASSVTLTSASTTVVSTVTQPTYSQFAAPDTTVPAPALTTTLELTSTSTVPITVTSTVVTTAKPTVFPDTLRPSADPVPVRSFAPLSSALFAQPEVKTLDDDLDLATELENQLPAVPSKPLANVTSNVTLDDLSDKVNDFATDLPTINVTVPDNYNNVTTPDNIWGQFRAFLSTSDGQAFFMTVIALGSLFFIGIVYLAIKYCFYELFGI